MDVGGPTTAASVILAGLVDEYRLFVNPVILGAGTPFFPAADDRRGLFIARDADLRGRSRPAPLRDRQVTLAPNA